MNPLPLITSPLSGASMLFFSILNLRAHHQAAADADGLMAGNICCLPERQATLFCLHPARLFASGLNAVWRAEAMDPQVYVSPLRQRATSESHARFTSFLLEIEMIVILALKVQIIRVSPGSSGAVRRFAFFSMMWPLQSMFSICCQQHQEHGWACRKQEP